MRAGYLLLQLVSRYVNVEDKLAILEEDDLMKRLGLILAQAQKFLDISEKKEGGSGAGKI